MQFNENCKCWNCNCTRCECCDTMLVRQVINGQLKATFSTDWAEQFSSCEDEAFGSVFTACFGEGDEETIR